MVFKKNKHQQSADFFFQKLTSVASSLLLKLLHSRTWASYLSCSSCRCCHEALEFKYSSKGKKMVSPLNRKFYKTNLLMSFYCDSHLFNLLSHSLRVKPCDYQSKLFSSSCTNQMANYQEASTTKRQKPMRITVPNE